MEYIYGYSMFFLACVISFFIPGFVILRHLTLFKERNELFIFSWFVGLCFFVLGTYLLSWIGHSEYYLVLLFLSIPIFIWQNRTFNKKALVHFPSNARGILIIVTGSLCFLAAMFLSGYETSRGMEYVGVNGVDGVRHVAYIKNMMQYFPPQRPELAGVELRGFHYFYDFILSRFAVFYKFSSRDLYFRYFPFFIGLLYGAGFYLFSSLLTKEKVKKNLILFFAYFSQSSLFILILFKRNLDLTNDAAVQPLGLIINPFTVLSIALLLAGLSLLPLLKKSWKYAIIIGLLLGVLSEIKIYAGLIGIGTLCVYSVYCILRSKWNRKILTNFISACLLTGLITAITYLPNNLHAGGLIFAPLLFYSHYLQTETLAPLYWEQRRQIYAAAHNWLRVIQLYVEAVAVFWFINLGSSLIILIKSKSLIRKTFWLDDGRFILTSAIIIPIIIGSLFIQSVSVFDTVQFFWIAIALIGIPTGIAFGSLYLRSGKVVKIIILLIVLASSVPGVLDFEKKYILPQERTTIEAPYLSVMRSIGQVIPSGKFFIYLPSREIIKSDTLVVPNLTNRSIYVGIGGIPSHENDQVKIRQGKQAQLFVAIKECNTKEVDQIMQQIGTKYILLTEPSTCLENMSSRTIISPDKKLNFYSLKLN